MNANDLEDFLNSLEHMSFNDIDELYKYAAKYIQQTNDAPLLDFEGYSPTEMGSLLYTPYDDGSPMKLHKLEESDYARIPLFNLIKYLANLIAENEEIKLTTRGNLPTKIVAELYNLGFIKDYFIESGLSKLYNEQRINGVHLAKIIIEMSGIARKRYNKLSLTRLGNRLLSNHDELLRLIFKTFTQKFNWGYFDRYETQIGQIGFAFSLLLISKYGDSKRLDTFYAEKYLKAFPKVLELSNPASFYSVNSPADCYSIRTFNRFLDYFGLIHIEADDELFSKEKFITKTDLFDKFIYFEPHHTSI